MTTVEVADRIGAPLERVWGLVSDFTGFIDAQGLSYTAEGQGIGMTRTLKVGGASITERLEELDETTHTTSYSIVESPLPVAGYRAWIALSDAGDGATTLRWWGTFQAEGDEQKAAGMIRGVYEAGVAGLKKALGVR